MKKIVNEILAKHTGQTIKKNQKDTDRDGMSDGYEYWFTEWNLESNKWTINPLTNSDANFDSDGDSYDCNGDGQISDSELFHNLAEFDSRSYGKRLAVGSFKNDSSIISYGAGNAPDLNNIARSVAD